MTDVAASDAIPAKPATKKSGIPGASFNLINNIVGAGVIGLPYAMRESGWIAGLLLLALVGYLTDRSLNMIVNLATRHPKLKGRAAKNYEDLASIPFGRAGKRFVMINMFVMAYGAMLAYAIIVKDGIPAIIGVADSRTNRQIGIIVFSLLFFLPLSMIGQMANLSWWSLVSVVAETFLVIFVAAYSPVKAAVADSGGFGRVLRGIIVRPTLFAGLGVLSTAMACQHCSFLVSGSMRDCTRRRWKTVTALSVAVAATLCGVIGTFGYLGFLDETQGNILNNFDPTGALANFARILVTVTLTLTYPMEAFVARHVLIQIFHGGEMYATNDRGGTAVFLCLGRHHLWALLIYLAVLLPGLFIENVGIVLSVAGAVGASSVAYIVPGMLYLGVNGEAFLDRCASWIGASSYSDEGAANAEEEGGDATGDSHLEEAANAKGEATGGEGKELPTAGVRRMSIVSPANNLSECKKPFWWYLGLFPLWCAIARRGSRGIRTTVGGAPEAPKTEDEVDAPEEDPNGDFSPSFAGFFWSIFLVFFGVLALVLGVTSNILSEFFARHAPY